LPDCGEWFHVLESKAFNDNFRKTGINRARYPKKLVDAEAKDYNSIIMGKKAKRAFLISLVILLAVFALFAIIRANMFMNAAPSKIVYIEEQRKERLVSLCVSDSNEAHSNKKILVTWNDKNDWFSYSMYYILGGACLKKNILYYCDINRGKIVSYDLLTDKSRDLVSHVRYPFYVSDDGKLVICSSKTENEPVRHFKWSDLNNKQEKSFSLDLGGYNSFIRPLKVFNNRYILFDAAMYETEGSRGYFLFDIQKGKILDVDSMNIIAINDDQIAYIKARGKSITILVDSLNTLCLLDLKTMKTRELWHNDDFDIQSISFKDHGQAVEMMGDLAVGKGKPDDEPYITKPITIDYNIKENKYTVIDRKAEIPPIIFAPNFSDTIGIFTPNRK
jgi:hypothetical protein